MINFLPTKHLFTSPKFAGLWLVIRIYVGLIWLAAGWEKLSNPVWVGDKAGVAVSGFLNGALQKTAGAHPDVQGWFAWLIQHIGLPNAALFSYLVTFGEILVGVALILGAFTAVAGILGLIMNFSYLFAGAVSINPVLVILQLFIVMSWRTAGLFGLDRILGPKYWRGKYFSQE